MQHIERLLSLMQDKLDEQTRLASLSSEIFNLRLNMWNDAAAPAGIDRTGRVRNLTLLEFNAGASIDANLRSLRSDVDVVVHLGAPFNGPDTISAMRSALDGTDRLDHAKGIIREAVRNAWGRPIARSTLSHGSHLLLASLHPDMYQNANGWTNAHDTIKAAQVIFCW